MKLDAQILQKIAFLSRLKLNDAGLLKSLERILVIAEKLPKLTTKSHVEDVYAFKTQPQITFNKKIFWKNVPLKRQDYIEVNAVLNER